MATEVNLGGKVNKVVYDGNTLIDLTADTVTADDMAEGVTAHAADGSTVTGVLLKATIDDTLSSTSTNPVQNKVINTALAGKLSTSGTAARATADASGNVITSTYAKLASPALTGTPTAPTAAAGTSTTQIATTAFVQMALSGASVGDTQDVDSVTYSGGAATIALTSPVTIAETSGVVDSALTVDVSALIPDYGKSRSAILIFDTNSAPNEGRDFTVIGAGTTFRLATLTDVYVDSAMIPASPVVVRFILCRTTVSTYCFYSVEIASDNLLNYMSLSADS